MPTQMAAPDHTVAIIGGGLAGLSAAYDLGRQGIKVTVLESSTELGGLASSFSIDGALVERFYHFICRADNDLLELVAELGLESTLHWKQVGTGYFHNGKLFPFGTPFDLLRFGPVPFAQRIAFGLNVIRSRFMKDWHGIDDRSAKEWLTTNVGREAYAVIWDPLLRIKFGAEADHISAAWIWHRIWRVASSRRRLWERDWVGYLERGSSTIVNALADKLRSMPNVQVLTDASVDQIEIAQDRVRGIRLSDGRHIQCTHAISTVPLPAFIQMASDLPPAYLAQLGRIKYVGIVCVLLRLRQGVTDNFWVNINDPAVAFNGFIEYSNLNPRPDLKGSHMVYVPFYTPTSDERYQRDDRSLLEEYAAALQRINPQFEPGWVEEHFVFREQYAQAICPTGFGQRVPAHETPASNLLITDSVQFYPEDRTISAAIRLGRRVAALTAANLQRAP